MCRFKIQIFKKLLLKKRYLLFIYLFMQISSAYNHSFEEKLIPDLMTVVK